MLIDDNHSVQAQLCRTTGCESRSLADVFRECRRLYGSNVIRQEPCDGSRPRYTCCTGCLNYRCTPQLFTAIRDTSTSRQQVVQGSQDFLIIDAVQV
uniref:Uncharacterized protein n=1 Tax=Tetranychus urticae TaxID=32264 RepID=T1L5Q0_TETUR